MYEFYYKIQNRIQYHLNIKKQAKIKYVNPQKQPHNWANPKSSWNQGQSKMTGMTIMEQRLRTNKICLLHVSKRYALYSLWKESAWCRRNVLSIHRRGPLQVWRCTVPLVDITIISESLLTYNFTFNLQNTSFWPDYYFKENLSEMWCWLLASEI